MSKLILCIGGNRSGKTYQGRQWQAEDPEHRIYVGDLGNGTPIGDISRLLRVGQPIKFSDERTPVDVWVDVVSIAAIWYQDMVYRLLVGEGYDVEVRKLTGFAPPVQAIVDQEPRLHGPG